MSGNAYKQLTLGLLIAAIIALFLAAATYLVSGFFGSATKILLIVGIGLLLGYFVASPESVLGAFRSRGVRYGGNTFAMVVLFIGIIGAGNWFVNQHSQTFDLTANKIHTLSPETIKLLKGLQQPVTATAFFTSDNFDKQNAQDLLQLYASQTSQFTYKMVDPVKDPGTTRQFGIVSDGTTVFQSGTNRKDVPSVDEQDFTSALLAVTNAERRKVYFVTGNGQADPTQATDQQGFHDALLALQNDNYVVDVLGATATAVPDDAAVVILTPGTQAMLQSQKDAITRYLGRGGKMLITSAGFQDNTDLNAILKPYGLQFQDGEVIELGSYLQQLGPQAPAIQRYQDPSNEITKNLSFSVFPLSDGVTKTDQPPSGMVDTILGQSSDQSSLQNHKTNLGTFQQGDVRGPIGLIATAEGTLAASPSAEASAGASASASPSAFPTLPPATPPAAPSSSASSGATVAPTATPVAPVQVTGADVNLKGGTKIVAVADTLWMSDQVLNQVPGNHDLLLNAVNHLVGNSALISIAPKSTTPGQVNLLGSDANLIFFTTTVFVPLAVIIVGAFVWWQRR